jgi:hypothetical protein
LGGEPSFLGFRGGAVEHVGLQRPWLILALAKELVPVLSSIGPGGVGWEWG